LYKKLGEKTLFDSLFTCTFARARATLRERERQKERERDEKQKTEITDRAALFFLFWGAIVFPFCSTSGASTLESARALVRLSSSSSFLHPRGKKTFFKNKKRVKNTSERESERDRAPKKKKKKKRHNDRFFFGSRLLLVFCFPFGVVVVVVCGEKKARGVRGRRRRRRRLTLGGPKEREKRYHLTEISIYLSIYLEFNDGTEENPHRTH
jgi:hypothetical protein